MKLLFDQNLSPRLVAQLADLYPGSQHVQFVGLESADDASVWQHALDGQFVLVSKDADFESFSSVSGPPPHIVWVQLGNCTTADVESLLRNSVDELTEFVANDVQAILELT
jgi:predicted nuclease of predicted toxin-antitoxin system